MTELIGLAESYGVRCLQIIWITLEITTTPEVQYLGKKKIQKKNQSFAKSTIFISITSTLGGLLIVIIVLFVFYRFRRKEHNNNKFGNSKIEAVPLNLMSTTTFLPASSSSIHHFKNGIGSRLPSQYHIPYDANWEVDCDNIEYQGLLGEGAFGRVMLAIVHGLPRLSGVTTVAVKMLKGNNFICTDYLKLFVETMARI